MDMKVWPYSCGKHSKGENTFFYCLPMNVCVDASTPSHETALLGATSRFTLGTALVISGKTKLKSCICNLNGDKVARH